MPGIRKSIADLLAYFAKNPKVLEAVARAVHALGDIAAKLLEYLGKKRSAKNDKERAEANAAYEVAREQARVELCKLRIKEKELEVERLRTELALEKLQQRRDYAPNEKKRVRVDREVEEVKRTAEDQTRATEAAGNAVATAEDLVRAAEAEDDDGLRVIASSLRLAP